MKMKLPILRKVTQRNGKKVELSKLTWDDWGKKLNEEVLELQEALHLKNKAAIIEEVLDVSQVCIGILAKLFKEGMSINNGFFEHNKKLDERGCEVIAEVKVDVQKIHFEK